MKRVGLAALFYLAMCSGIAHADSNYQNDNSNSSINTSGSHNTVTVGSPTVNDGTDVTVRTTTEAEAHQLQGQFQGQASDQANQQDASLSVVNTTPRERVLLKGSASASVPQGNEGLMALTPWGGPAITQTSSIQKIALYCETLSRAEKDVTECLDWMRADAKPRTFLGVPHSSGLCRNWLTGLACF